MMSSDKLKNIKTVRDTFFSRIVEGIGINVKKDVKGNEYILYSWTPYRNRCDIGLDVRKAMEMHNFSTRFYGDLIKHVVKFYRDLYDPFEMEIMSDDVQRSFIMNSLKIMFMEKYVLGDHPKDENPVIEDWNKENIK